MSHITGHIEGVNDEEYGILPENNSTGSVGSFSPTTQGNPTNTDTDNEETQNSSEEQYLNLLSPEESEKYKPLGNNFYAQYEIETGEVDATKGPLFDKIRAEEFLTSDEYQEARRKLFGSGQAWKYVYLPSDIGAQARQMTPYIITQTKGLLAAAGLIDLNKTYGSEIDAEFLKGVKLAMEFSMNNGGQMSWNAAVKILAGVSKGQQAASQGVYTFDDEQMDEFVGEMLKKAKTRKGSPLSQYEKQYIKNKLETGPGEDFKTSLQGLGSGSEPSLTWQGNALQGQAVFNPGTGAEEPDIDILTEGGQDVIDEIFEPREDLQGVANQEDETFYRMSQNLAGLKAAENTPVPRTNVRL